MSIIKRLARVFGLIQSCVGIILLVLTVMYKNEADWFANVFHDKVYVFQLATLYMAGIIYLDRYLTTPVLTRMESRKKTVFVTLGIKCGFAFIYLCIFFSLICIIASVKFTYIHEKTAVEIFYIFIRYFMGLTLLAVFAEIIRRSEIKLFSGNAHLCTILIMALEVIVIVPEICKNTPFKPHFIFSWVFYDEISGYIALFTILVFALIYLFKVSIRKDIL